MSSRHIRGNLVFKNYLEKTSAGNIAAADLANASLILVNKDSGAATAITLPAAGYVGQAWIIVDAKGDAGTNNITITPASGNINGSATYVINENYEAVILVWDGTNYTIVGGGGGGSLSAAESGYLDGVTAGTGEASKAAVLDASGNFTMPDDGMLGLSRDALAAAGSTSADAAVIADQVVAVTAADGTKGVALPAAATTEGPILVINTVEDKTLKVYPVNGGNDLINGLAEDAAFVMQGGEAALFIATSATQWYARPLSSADAQKLSTEAGTGITTGSGTVYKSSVQRQGGIITTRILIDLTGLTVEATDGDIIGVADTDIDAHIGRITAARNGTIFGGTMTCLEVPTTGNNDVNLYAADEATGSEGDAISGLTETALLDAGGAWTLGEVQALSAVPAANQYLYLTNGAGAGAGVYDAGKFLIELYGY